MRNKKVYLNLFGIITITMLMYCLLAYQFLQSRLTVELIELTARMKTIGNLTVPALFVVGLYHICLMSNALKTLTGKFKDSIYFVLIILSGITLFSDLTLLSDIGKEYLFWDVTSQWIILYGFTLFQMVVVIFGFIHLLKNPAHNSKLFKHSGNRDGVLFLSLHHIGVISGVLGLCGVIFSATGIMTPDRYITQFMVVLAGLALFPLILFIVYWILKLKGRPFRQWFDEKQINDTALGTLLNFVITIPLYIFICIVELTNMYEFHVFFLIMIIFFLQLSIFSSVVIARNK
ncbi:MAG: hypothetical protein ACOWWH_10100 [Eubacteriaceae bacterium]